MTDIDRRTLIALSLTAATLPATIAAAAEAETIPLWPGRPPGARATLPTPGRKPTAEARVTGVARPTLVVRRPAKANGIGVLVIPGGGYGFVSLDNEGNRVADRLTAQGYTAFILTYRLPAEGWDAQSDVPLQDAQRAMRLIRTGAARFGIDPAKVGVLGFSAGGHLAATLATAYDERVYTPVDAADRQNARPAFAGLMYAVTTLELPDTHAGSRENLLGKTADDVAVLRRSPLRHIDAGTPPCFLVHALDDDVVPASCSLRWLDACIAAKVPVEAQILQSGGHGFGVQLPDTQSGSLWPEAFVRWVPRQLA
jgi:acetyl esterase/lipase